MTYDPNVAPQNQEEFDELISIKVTESQNEYDTKVAEAEANATEQWNNMIPAKRAELIDKGLTENEIKAHLAQEKTDYINQSISMIEQPHNEEYFTQMYSFFKTWDNNDPVQEAVIENYMVNSVINLNGRYYDVSEGDFISKDEIGDQTVLTIGAEPTLENLENFITYEHNNDPEIPLMSEEVIIKEKFHMLREERDKRIAETDYLMNSDYPISEEDKEEVMEYRTALRDLPSQPGAPWDGGGEETPWPVKP